MDGCDESGGDRAGAGDLSVVEVSVFVRGEVIRDVDVCFRE